MALSLHAALLPLLLLAAFAASIALSHPLTTSSSSSSLTPATYINTAVQATSIDYANVSSVLATLPEFTLYNRYLTETRVADEINSARSRPDGVTCLVLTNPAMSDLAAGRPLSAIKAALRSLTLLRYYDPAVLRAGRLLPNATLAPTLLLRTPGAGAGSPSLVAAGRPGGMSITVRDNGFKKCVVFRPSAEPANCSVYLTRPVAVLPEDRISVLEVTRPASLPRVLDAALPPPDNLTAALEDAEGCGAFAALLASAPQAVARAYEAAYQMDRRLGGSATGLTVFVPDDDAFRGNVSDGIGRLSSRGVAKLLLYHAVREYFPESTLRAVEGRRVATLLTGTGTGTGGDASGAYDIGVTACGDDGDDVCIETAHGRTARVTSTVIDSPPLCVLAIDTVLVPTDLFKPKKAASAPSSLTSDASSPKSTRSNGHTANSRASSPPTPSAATKPIAAHTATAPAPSVRTPSSVPPSPPPQLLLPAEEETNQESGGLRASPSLWMSLLAGCIVMIGR